jgi:hypothetical protein
MPRRSPFKVQSVQCHRYPAQPIISLRHPHATTAFAPSSGPGLACCPRVGIGRTRQRRRFRIAGYRQPRYAQCPACRLAGLPAATTIQGSLEILTLAGTLAPDGAHLHISVADERGRVLGGHVGYGCTVRTTAEILIVLLPDYRFSREPDPESGYKELAIRMAHPPASF